MSRGKRNDVALYEGISTLPGVNSAGWLPGVGAAPGGAQGESHESLWKVVDDRMRGRWLYAIGCGGLLSALLGTVGYLSAEPLFVSQGTIEIAQEVKKIYYDVRDVGEIPNYDRFVATQVEYIKGGTVISAALEDPDVQKLHLTKGILKSGLQVERDPRSQLIFVSFEAEDADVAVVAVNALLHGYYELHGQYAKQQIDNTLHELDSKLQEETRKRTQLEAEIRTMAMTYNATDLAAVQKNNLEQINKLQMTINDSKRAIKRLPKPPAGEIGESETATVRVATMEALKNIDPRLAQLEQLLLTAQSEFELISVTYKPGSRAYTNAEQKFFFAKKAYDAEYLVAQDKWNKLKPEEKLKREMSTALAPAEIEDMEKDLEEIQQYQQRLVGDIAALAHLQAEQATVQEKISGMSERMTAIETEMGRLSNTITVSQYGTRPELPTKDARRMRLLMGLGLGMGASFGAFFLLGTIDRRAFGASQLTAGALGGNLPPCLGVLPDLGESLNDPQTSDIASHCVHQIRNQIEAVREPSAGYVLAISSPFQGDGKTSIVMALGWSYAAAGYSTLVIDCDMVGRSLTRQLGLTGREGLKEALVAKELNGSVNTLPWANLSAVPVGVDARFGPENVRRIDLENLINQVRDQYDIILVDTGPLLGALESTPVMAVSDGVVLSVRRGRSRSKLEECVTRIKMVGTSCIGVILNCAPRSDCNRYVSEASLAAAEEERIGRDGMPKADAMPSPGQRNALVRAVQSTTRQRQHEEHESVSQAVPPPREAVRHAAPTDSPERRSTKPERGPERGGTGESRR